MSYSVFTDKNHQPAAQDILNAVGSQIPLWNNLNRWITDNIRVKSDYAFYGKNYGWSIRYRKGGKALLSMYPGNNEFTVLIVISPNQVEQAFNLNLSANFYKVLNEAHPYPEGRWLFIKVESAQDLDDVRKLIALKSPHLKK